MDFYQAGLLIAFICVAISFIALLRERDDIHKILIVDLIETTGLVIICLVASDLAEALILPGLVVGLSELLMLSELYLRKEKLPLPRIKPIRIEVMDSAPHIIAFCLVVYGLILSGFTGGAVAGIGIVFFFLCKGYEERFELLETVSGYSWALWIGAFFIFMIIPQAWLMAVMLAGAAILIKVTTKMALIGTMREGRNV